MPPATVTIPPRPGAASHMDVPRPAAHKVAQRRRRIVIMATLIVGVIALTVVLARLKPAVPTVERNLVWIDTVKRGPMVRQVRGLGALVPEEIRWVAARTSGRVEKILLRPGAVVEPENIILILNNPVVEQEATAADSQLAAAEAELVNIKIQLQRDVLTAESIAASAKADFEQSRLKAEVNAALFARGLLGKVDLELTRITAEQASIRYEIEKKRLGFARDSMAPQVSVKESALDRLRAQARLRHDEFAALAVKAGMRGVLQVLPVEIGAQVQPGSNLARVADPTKLKAEIRIAETQAKDIQIGQTTQIDTRNGLVAGRVTRIDPSVQNGTVTVDIGLQGELPKGARPDLSVDGMIELERLEDIVFTGRPAFGQERSTVGIFKLEADGAHAVRVPVQLGCSSVNTVEIVSGLQPGDRVILSDMSQWDSADRIKLN